jgi:hypothetical protein
VLALVSVGTSPSSIDATTSASTSTGAIPSSVGGSDRTTSASTSAHSILNYL